MASGSQLTALRCVVLAQGLGRRGQAGFLPAQLKLLQRTLCELRDAGITDLQIIDGDEPDRLFHQLAAVEGLTFKVVGDGGWQRYSASVLDRWTRREGAIGNSDDSLLVVRGNQPPGAEAFAALLEACGRRDAEGGAMITVRNEEPLSKENRVEEWKVQSKNGRATAIGMDLDAYDEISAGHFLLQKNALEYRPENADCAVEELLRVEHGIVCVKTERKWPLVPQPVRVEHEVEELLCASGRRKYTLLNPGPVNTTARVKSALVHHDLCHRDRGFSELMASLTNKLRRIFRGSLAHSICVLTGSGTAALESALTKVASKNDKLLVIDNGAFGERMVEVARVHGIDLVHLQYSWGSEIELADVEKAFAKHPDIGAVSMIHHETSVGLLNPVRAVGDIVRQHDALFVVDAVSSLGAEDLDVCRDNIDICFSSANKCLHAVSGVGFACVSPRVWEKTAHIPPASFYLDLGRYRSYGEELAQTPFTPAVSSFFALEAACSEFLADGHRARFDSYRRKNSQLRKGLAQMGMRALTETGKESHSVVTCSLPPDICFSEFYDGLRSHGFIVYACKGPLAGTHFQVANMGDLSAKELNDFLSCARMILRRMRAADEGLEKDSGLTENHQQAGAHHAPATSLSPANAFSPSPALPSCGNGAIQN